MSDKLYYIAAGRSLEALEKEWKPEHLRVNKARKKFMKRMGTFEIFTDGSSIQGLIYKSAADAAAAGVIGLRLNKRCKYSNVYVPDMKSVQGKALHKELVELTYPAIPVAVGKFQIIASDEGLVSIQPGIELVDDKWLIVTHPKAQPPLDAKLIKASEYWQIKENRTARKER